MGAYSAQILICWDPPQGFDAGGADGCWCLTQFRISLVLCREFTLGSWGQAGMVGTSWDGRAWGPLDKLGPVLMMEASTVVHVAPFLVRFRPLKGLCFGELNLLSRPGVLFTLELIIST